MYDGKRNRERKAKKGFVFGIRNKIIICFLVPVLFMVLLGAVSYQKAADGMSTSFRETALQTMQMATEYMDVSESFIESEGLKYVVDPELERYFIGLYNSDPVKAHMLIDEMKTRILASQVGNPFISNIHIMPRSDKLQMISTKTKAQPGIYEEYTAELGAGGELAKWGDRHDALDAYLEIDPSEYIMTCQLEPQSKKAVVIIDIKADAVFEFLQGLHLGEGSFLGFVTSGGRELAVQNTETRQPNTRVEGKTIFADQDFYRNASENSGVSEVNYEGESYLFFHSRSERTGASMCALVPMHIVTGQAESIKNITVIGVLLSSVIAIVIGGVIASGIRRNMKRISGSLQVVAEGNLATTVSVKGRDEFRGLATAANDMIANNKKLVQKVSQATDKLEVSAGEVTEASGIIQEYSQDIAQAIAEINDGIEKQTIHAQECVRKTDTLSEEIQQVNRIAREVEALGGNAEKMIGRGIELVGLLGERAGATTEITAKVEESIQELKRESEIIDRFVAMITDISEQTNLLSLNASIEAARAGEAGRGFAVVAEEIRNLADNSAEAAGEIRNNVEHINTQTVISVESAKKAGSMVALQTEAVKEVTGVFQNMSQAMEALFRGLKDIVVETENADREREGTLDAVRNISHIIEETAASAQIVKNVAENLQQNVENLNGTAEGLGDNMSGLKTEVSVFKTE